MEKEEKKEKKKKGLWDKMWNKDKIVKKNKIAVIYLRNNGIAEPMELESNRGMFTIENKTYHEDADCIYTIKKDRVPLAIIPEWGLIPYGKKEQESKSMEEKFAQFQDHAMRGIRHAERVRFGDKDQMKLNGKAIVGIIIMVIIGAALLGGYM